MPFGDVSELKVFLDCNDILHEKMNGLDLEKINLAALWLKFS